MVIPICSILPQFEIFAQAKTEEPRFVEMAKIANLNILWGKWTVNNLVRYKRKHDNWVGSQKELYWMKIEDVKILKKRPENVDFTNELEWTLYRNLLELTKYENINHYSDRLIGGALASAYSICKKLESQISKYGRDALVKAPSEKDQERMRKWPIHTPTQTQLKNWKHRINQL
jgi:hypothetical protein